MAKKRGRPKKNSTKKDSDSQVASNKAGSELVALGQSLREGSEEQKVAALSEVGEYGREGLNLAVDVLRSSGSFAPVKEAAYALVQKLASQIERVLRESDPNPHPEVHAIGVYEARNKKIKVNVKRKGIPLVLVLASYESVLWEINPEEDVTIGKVIVSGYYLQKVTGIEPDIPVELTSCHKVTSEEKRRRIMEARTFSDKAAYFRDFVSEEGHYFLLYDITFAEALKTVEEENVMNITTLQNGYYNASEFTIEGELTTKVWRDR